MSNYLEIIEKVKPKKEADEARPTRPTPSNGQTTPATKETKAAKVPDLPVTLDKSPRDKRDQSDKREAPNFTPLTVSEVLAEINRWGSGASRNAELHRRGELSEEKAVEYVTCAILQRRGEPFGVWGHHSPTVRKALSLCIHELEPDECKVCNGYVKRLIEDGRP